MDDVNRVMADRLRKLDELRAAGINPFANGFEPSATCAELLAAAEAEPPPGMTDIPDGAPEFQVAGRLVAKHKMGKAMFLRVRDRTVGDSEDGPKGLQIYVRRDVVDEATFKLFKGMDVGDFVGVEGPLFATRTGEPTVMVQRGQLLTKSLRPLPEKFHGLSDVETRYRQRYVDLVVNPGVKEVFRVRAATMRHIRSFLEARDFVEVETPMMQPIPGGATARPFETHHNALGIPLYLRIAPELYLKRLVVGGLERVFELNRNFRNEGLSPKHNPEFTMLELYQGYATYEDLITLTEELVAELVASLNGPEGGTVRPYGEHQIDYARPFARYTMMESLTAVAGVPAAEAASRDALLDRLATLGIELDADLPYGKVLNYAFEHFVEALLIQPTFITHYPTVISPLARRSESDPTTTDRFEFFVAGMECANAFSELNDPIDQRERFEAQVADREAGDEHAMYMDLDYVRALEYGMPPTAGEGVGIDRLVMLMTNRHTIREVIFFPHMRPETPPTG